MPGIPLSYIPIEQPKKPSQKQSYQFKKVAIGVLLVIPLLCVIIFLNIHRAASHILCIKPIHQDFVGREQYFSQIEKICTHVVGSTLPVVVLWGEAGVGKSEIALTFANKNIKKYSLISMIDCSSEENYKMGYYTLAKKLNLQLDPKEALQENVKKIHLFMEKKYKPWLLIYDNAETSIELPQKGKGVVIITTRNHNPWLLFDCIEVGPLTAEEASGLFTKIIREEAGLYRLSLLQELGFFPMALSIAAHYIADSSMSEQKYLQLLTQDKIQLIETCKNSEQILASWQITAQMLNEKHPKALEWLHFCSFLNPNGVTIAWMEKWLNQESSFTRKLKSDDILRILVNHALVAYDKKAKKIHLHRLKQEVIKRDSFFNPEMQNHVFQFLLDHTQEQDWDLHAIWFLQHYGHTLIADKASLLEALIEDKKKYTANTMCKK
jgi:hypothetical protein